MDPIELRLRRIEMALRSAEKAAELQGHRRIAVVAVSLTLAGSAAIAGAGGQLHAAPAAVLVIGAGVVVAAQLVVLRRVEQGLEQASREALKETDTLITPGGERSVDGEDADEGRPRG